MTARPIGASHSWSDRDTIPRAQCGTPPPPQTVVACTGLLSVIWTVTLLLRHFILLVKIPDRVTIPALFISDGWVLAGRGGKVQLRGQGRGFCDGVSGEGEQRKRGHFRV